MVSNSIINNSIVHVWQPKGFGCGLLREWQQRSRAGAPARMPASLRPCSDLLKIWKAARLPASSSGSYLLLAAPGLGSTSCVSPLKAAIRSPWGELLVERRETRSQEISRPGGTHFSFEFVLRKAHHSVSMLPGLSQRHKGCGRCPVLGTGTMSCPSMCS